MATMYPMTTQLMCVPAPVQQLLPQPNVPMGYQLPYMCMPYPNCQPIVITLPPPPDVASPPVCKQAQNPDQVNPEDVSLQVVITPSTCIKDQEHQICPKASSSRNISKSPSCSSHSRFDPRLHSTRSDDAPGVECEPHRKSPCESMVVEPENETPMSDCLDTFLRTSFVAWVQAGDEESEVIDMRGLSEESILVLNRLNNMLRQKKMAWRELVAANAAKQRLDCGRNEDKEQLYLSYCQHKRNALLHLRDYKKQQCEYKALLALAIRNNQGIKEAGNGSEELELLNSQLTSYMDPESVKKSLGESHRGQENLGKSVLPHVSFIEVLENDTFSFDGLDIEPLTPYDEFMQILRMQMLAHKQIIIKNLRDAKDIKEKLESGEPLPDREFLMSQYREKKRAASEQIVEYFVQQQQLLSKIKDLKCDLDNEPPMNVQISRNKNEAPENYELISFAKVSDSRRSELDDDVPQQCSLTQERDEEEKSRVAKSMQNYFQQRRNAVQNQLMSQTL
ncbi:hypothetical protein Zmor_025129 [Zophobas morio]|uniref:Uncharacterized protein n=1 Tax=Zophobas morio TaxID=2755281 RepID=A0AA38HR07_9CUCU|nr:hypothetical protein Zmor_025129 [Zophobas morio]